MYTVFDHKMLPQMLQAGPSNAVFFLFYDTLNALGTAAVLGGTPAGGAGPLPPVVPAALHLSASSIATVPTNLVRTPAEVVKQRLQVLTSSGRIDGGGCFEGHKFGGLRVCGRGIVSSSSGRGAFFVQTPIELVEPRLTVCCRGNGREKGGTCHGFKTIGGQEVPELLLRREWTGVECSRAAGSPAAEHTVS